MPFETFDHTADLGLEVCAPTRSGLFADATRGFYDSFVQIDSISALEERFVSARAGALDLLLLAWLEELLFLFDTEELLLPTGEVSVTAGDDGTYRIEASLRGERFRAGTHPQKVQIKAVTYHRLRVWEENGLWRARVVFDI